MITPWNRKLVAGDSWRASFASVQCWKGWMGRSQWVWSECSGCGQSVVGGVKGCGLATKYMYSLRSWSLLLWLTQILTSDHSYHLTPWAGKINLEREKTANHKCTIFSHISVYKPTSNLAPPLPVISFICTYRYKHVIVSMSYNTDHSTHLLLHGDGLLCELIETLWALLRPLMLSTILHVQRYKDSQAVK